MFRALVTKRTISTSFPLELPQGEFAAFIFDCDGTLADTMPLHWRAWAMITQRYDLHFPEDLSLIHI